MRENAVFQTEAFVLAKEETMPLAAEQLTELYSSSTESFTVLLLSFAVLLLSFTVLLLRALQFFY